MKPKNRYIFTPKTLMLNRWNIKEIKIEADTLTEAKEKAVATIADLLVDASGDKHPDWLDQDYVVSIEPMP